MTTKAKTRMIIFGSFCLAFFGYLIFSVFAYTVDLYKLNKNKDNLQREYITLQENAEELKIEITKLQDPEYLAKFARENYLYSKEGELIIKINETNPEKMAVSTKDKADRLIVTASLAAIGLIFLYILIRSTKKRNQEA
jgi:Septum formation initiator